MDSHDRRNNPRGAQRAEHNNQPRRNFHDSDLTPLNAQPTASGRDGHVAHVAHDHNPPRYTGTGFSDHRGRFSYDDTYDDEDDGRHSYPYTEPSIPERREPMDPSTAPGTTSSRQLRKNKQGKYGVHEEGVLASRRSKPRRGGKPHFKLDRYREWVERQKKKTKGPSEKFEKWFDEWYQRWIIQFLLRQYPLPPSKDGRHVPIAPGETRKTPLKDERRGGKPYTSNRIRSSRYTIWSFLPKQLYFQFSRLANFYFLVIGALQLAPGLSTTGSWTTIGPLILFVALSMAKEAWDDYRRYKMDKSENRSLVWVLDPAHVSSSARKKHGKHGKHDDGDHRKARRGSRHLEGVTSELHQADIWTKLKWEDLKVGDIIRLERDDSLPADIVLLHATGPNGIAYIETAALDGETNLKSKQSCKILADRCKTLDELRAANAVVVSEDPNLDLYSFEGRATVDGKTLPLTLNDVVYRGSTLRNTVSAIGLIVNTGEECKIRMNANSNVRAKAPAMQSTINGIVLFLVFAVLLLSGGLTVGYEIWKAYYEPIGWYLRGAEVTLAQITIGYLIMFYALIPLSLYVSMEIIKVGQFMLLQDVEMYDPETDTPMTANTTTILENLGQVSYVFSDKTGTLTENKMRFRKFTVAGTPFLHDMDLKREMNERSLRGFDEKSKQAGTRQGDEEHARPSLVDRNAPSQTAGYHSKPAHQRQELNSETLVPYLRQNPNTAFSKKARHFLLCIALCHTCLPEVKENGEIEFQAASPDELALVQAARDLGYLLIDRPTQSIVLEFENTEGVVVHETYQVLDIIEFSSKRKRMSIIVRMPDGRICVLCKGADSAILPLLRQSKLASEKAADVGRRASKRRSMQAAEQALYRRSTHGSFSPRNSANIRRTSSNAGRNYRGASGDDDIYQSHGHSRSEYNNLDREIDGRIDETVAADDGATFDRCFQHINDFATEGLRTLLYGYRYIDDRDYSSWKKIYHEATTSLVERQERIEKAGELIEQGFDLAGATAIEDKLQAGVPDTIDKLRRANIKVWMLTGDKRETAIEIANSARICKPFSELYILDATEGDLEGKISSTLEDITREDVAHSVVVVDGGTLGAIEQDESLRIMFFDLVTRIDSVICCRASPSQKATLVKHIRDTVPSSLTLAIGDGANDIAMIQAAHVGIGISGREGLQAARISDFSIGQFRFLQRLLFVHGRWNYQRTGKYVLATFWKEVVFYICQAQYQRWNGYTGTSLYENWSLTVFNVLFTSLPVIIPGIFEKELRASTLLAVPELYTYGQRNMAFNFKKYVGWMLMGAIETIIIYMLIYTLYTNLLFTSDNTIFAMGQGIFTVCVVFINVKLFILEMHHKTLLTLGCFALSTGGWFIWNVLISASNLITRSPSPFQVRDSITQNFGRQLIWWAACLLALAAVVVFELAVTALRRVYMPEDQDLWQEIERLGTVDEVLQEHIDDVAAERGEAIAAQGQKHGANPFDDDQGTVSTTSPVSRRNESALSNGHSKGKSVDTTRSSDWPLRSGHGNRGEGNPIELDMMGPSPRR